MYKYANKNQQEKRELVRLVTSERLVQEKTPMFMLAPAFQELADRSQNTGGGAPCAIRRDVQQVIDRIIPIVAKEIEKPAA